MSEDIKRYHNICDWPNASTSTQTHVHEFEGSVRIAEAETDPHNHRFAGVSGEVIPRGKSHVHEIFTNTDFYENHHHEVRLQTGLAIDVGDGRHVHFATSRTTLNDGHFHELRVGTQIQDPIGD